MQTELLPCPFCGSPEVHLADAVLHYVVCTACNAFGPTESVEPWGTEWNRRAQRQQDAYAGMSLRQYAAVQFMQAMIGSAQASQDIRHNDPRYSANFADVVAQNAFEFADAFLKASER